MTELKPLLETSSSASVRELLEAARDDAPPADFQGRVLVGLGMGAAVVSSSTEAAAGNGVLLPAAASPKAAAGALTVVKWLVIGVAGGTAMAAGADALWVAAPASSSSEAGSLARGDRVALQPSADLRVSLTEAPGSRPGEPARPALPVARLSSGPASPPTTSAPQGGQLGREVRLIDAARKAFAEGQLSRAFAELEAYDRVARTGVLDREARVLRIQILHRAGDGREASRLIQQYLLEFPGDEHAARLRALSPASDEQ